MPWNPIFLGLVCALLLMALGSAEAKSKSEASRLRGLDPRIKHIVVLMEENRAFDHLLGHYPGVNGLNGTEFNLVNTSNPNSAKVFVTPNAPALNQCDPDHGYPATTFKIFGADAAAAGNHTNPTMGGFVMQEWLNDWDGSNVNYCDVMQSFTPDRIPIMTSLAENFVLMDRFFAAFPGPTWPNRLFFMAGTSSGLTETMPWYRDVVGQLFPTRTIFDQVEEAGGSWKVYYNDTPWELWVETLAHHPENYHSMAQFFADCESGDLPDFAFINPRSGINITEGLGSNDQHPDHDMAVAERWIKDIYEGIRASPAWNETLLVLTYDEHGGFYDHVPPPMNVPPPGDGESSFPDVGVKFDRLGIRIPTILISPWVPKGVILSEPPAAQKPAANSEYSLTSIIASARKLLPVLNNTGPLTARDAWSATFEHVFYALDTIRSDCPMHLPEPLPPTLSAEVEAKLPINGLQRHIMTVHAHLAGHKFPSHIAQQGLVGDWLQERFAEHKNKTLAWKKSKAASAATFSIVVQPVFQLEIDSKNWKIYRNETLPGLPMTITNWLPSATYCLDNGDWSEGVVVTVSICYPSPLPWDNRDKCQHWLVHNDATIRPFYNASLCMQNDYFTGVSEVTLRPCVEGLVNQHWAYHGTAPGMDAWGTIFFGDWTTALTMMINL